MIFFNGVHESVVSDTLRVLCLSTIPFERDCECNDNELVGGEEETIATIHRTHLDRSDAELDNSSDTKFAKLVLLGNEDAICASHCPR